MQVQIVKRHLNWFPGQVIEVSEANAAKLKRDGVAIVVASKQQSVPDDLAEDTNSVAEKPKRKKKIDG